MEHLISACDLSTYDLTHDVHISEWNVGCYEISAILLSKLYVELKFHALLDVFGLAIHYISDVIMSPALRFRESTLGFLHPRFHTHFEQAIHFC